MKTPPIDAALIAPCGMNCAICIGHLRTKRPCGGCNGDDQSKPKHCVVCAIKHCAGHARAAAHYCFACDKFPCLRLKRLDQRYRMNYGMSMIDNLREMEAEGVAAFAKHETQRWQCAQCGALLCVHRDTCLSCGVKR
jgi:hypothetical protein